VRSALLSLGFLGRAGVELKAFPVLATGATASWRRECKGDIAVSAGLLTREWVRSAQRKGHSASAKCTNGL
jgi:hypothetical protein